MIISKRPGLVLPATTLAGLTRCVDYRDTLIYLAGEGQNFALSGGRLSALRDPSKERSRPRFASEGLTHGMKLLSAGGVSVLDGSDSLGDTDGYELPVPLLNGHSGLSGFFVLRRPNAALSHNEDLLSVNLGGGSAPNFTMQMRANAINLSTRLADPETGATGAQQSTACSGPGSNVWATLFFYMDFATGAKYLNTLTSAGAFNQSTGTPSTVVFPLSYFDPSIYIARMFCRPGAPAQRVKAHIHRAIIVSGAHMYNDGALGQLIYSHCTSEMARVVAAGV